MLCRFLPWCVPSLFPFPLHASHAHAHSASQWALSLCPPTLVSFLSGSVLQPNFIVACLGYGYEEHCQARSGQGKTTLSQFDWLSSPAADALGDVDGALVEAHLNRASLRQEWLHKFHQGIGGPSERVMMGKLCQLARVGDLAIRERLFKRIIGHIQEQLVAAFTRDYRRVLHSVRLSAGVVVTAQGGAESGGTEQKEQADAVIAQMITRFAREEINGGEATVRTLEVARDIRRQRGDATTHHHFCIGE